ncbi:organic hydroperoxide resistance protein [Ancylobacter sp. VNQ12]|uniref:organic hydroperoxide resistance protein n=1 Tax=Ancylobacter sp. VNQ12 TaxID=3400920 RepID=UPI003C02236B
MKILYQAHGTATGGRNGRAFTDDGKLDLRLAMPGDLGGPGGEGTNPEQLFACGYAACFDSALAHVARQQKLDPGETRVDAMVGIGPNDKGGFALAVRLSVTVPGLPRDQAQALIEQAHAVCPYSNAVRGNVDVVLELR